MGRGTLTTSSQHQSQQADSTSSNGDYRLDATTLRGNKFDSLSSTSKRGIPLQDVPTFLGQLTLLTELVLSHNQLVSSLPTELGNLHKLSTLALESNLLTGSIVTEVGNLHNLKHMYLGDNSLTSNLPSEVGKLDQLIVFDASRNQISGSIPRTYVFWPTGGSLEEFWLFENDMTGVIPKFLPGSLRDLDLSLNRFHGPSK